MSTAENECKLSRSGYGRATVGRWPGLCPCFESLQRMVPLDRRCKFSALGACAPFWSAVCGSGHDIRYLREGAEESQRKSSSIHKIKRHLVLIRAAQPCQACAAAGAWRSRLLSAKVRASSRMRFGPEGGAGRRRAVGLDLDGHRVAFLGSCPLSPLPPAAEGGGSRARVRSPRPRSTRMTRAGRLARASAHSSGGAPAGWHCTSVSRSMRSKRRRSEPAEAAGACAALCS